MSGSEFSADLVELTPDEGLKTIQNLKTGGNEVYAACLLFAGQHGVSMSPDLAEDPDEQVLILGCNNGFAYKYEK